MGCLADVQAIGRTRRCQVIDEFDSRDAMPRRWTSVCPVANLMLEELPESLPGAGPLALLAAVYCDGSVCGIQRACVGHIFASECIGRAVRSWKIVPSCGQGDWLASLYIHLPRHLLPVNSTLFLFRSGRKDFIECSHCCSIMLQCSRLDWLLTQAAA